MFRLIARAAWFLAPRAEDIDDRVRLARELKEIYEARSSLVHTGVLSAKLKRRDVELANRAVALLRESLVRFLDMNFGQELSAEKLTEVWLLLTMGQSTLPAMDTTQPSLASQEDESPGVAAPAASAQAPPSTSEEPK